MSEKYHKSIKLKIYPNKHQKRWIIENFRNCKFIWNKTLRMLNDRYENNPDLPIPTKMDLSYLRKPLSEEYTFLKYGDSKSYEYVFMYLILAFKNFFKKISRHPRFKKSNNSYLAKILKIDVEKKKIKLPKVGWIKYRQKFDLSGLKIQYATISKDSTDRFYISVTYETKTKDIETGTQKPVGIDMGIADEAILSNGEKVHTVNFSKQMYQDMYNWQKKLARRRLGAKKRIASFNHEHKNDLQPKKMHLIDCKNYQKARKIVARKYKHYSNKRKDYINNVTTNIVKRFDVIVIEDLKPSNLIKNRHLSKSIANASWRMFRTQLEQKCAFYGKKLIVIPPYKTSQICSTCGYDDGYHDLSIREWTCPNCNSLLDRDVNAARNILNNGLQTL